MFTFKKLKRLGLIEQDGTGYQATETGTELIKQANEEHWWQTTTGAPIAPPTPKKRNK